MRCGTDSCNIGKRQVVAVCSQTLALEARHKDQENQEARLYTQVQAKLQARERARARV